jgi:hypothetical protein
MPKISIKKGTVSFWQFYCSVFDTGGYPKPEPFHSDQLHCRFGGVYTRKAVNILSLTLALNPSMKAQRWLIPVLFLAAVALGTAAVKFNNDLTDANTQIESLKKDLASSDAKLASARADVKRLSLEAQELSGGPSPDNSAPDQAAPASDQPKKSPMAQMAEMMAKNPAMRQMIADQQKQQIQRQYGDLIKSLNLSPDEADQFLKLLSDKQMSQMDAGLKLAAGNLSADDRAALVQQIKDNSDAGDAQIKEFLNNDADYTQYQTYTQQMPERQEVSTLSSSLAAAGQPLDPSQVDPLVQMMADERANFKFTGDLGNGNSNPDPSKLTGAAIDSYLQQEAQLQSQIADRAASILTPEQLEVFKQNQANQLQMQKVGMSMARQMMGSGQ